MPFSIRLNQDNYRPLIIKDLQLSLIHISNVRKEVLLYGTVQQNLLPHVRIDLCRPVFGKAGMVKVFLRFPLQQVGRLDVCEGVSAFRQFPDRCV